MSYGESLLAKGEQVVYRGRQHWLAPISDSLRPFFILLVGVVVFILAAYTKASGLAWTVMAVVSAVLLIVGIIWITVIDLTWRAQEYLITNRRVIKIEGLLDKKTADSALDKINDAVLSQGLLARMFGYGDLDILTAAETEVDHYTMLAHAVVFKKAMLDSKNQLEYGDRPSVSGAATAPSGDLETKLDQLSDLLKRGKISQADYDRKKADLLDKM